MVGCEGLGSSGLQERRAHGKNTTLPWLFQYMVACCACSCDRRVIEFASRLARDARGAWGCFLLMFICFTASPIAPQHVWRRKSRNRPQPGAKDDRWPSGRLF